MRSALRLERTRWLESLLVVMAIGLSVAVLIVTGSVLAVNERIIAAWDDSIEARRLTLGTAASDNLAYQAGADARRLGSIYTPQPRFTPEDAAAALRAAPSVDYWYQVEPKPLNTTAWDGRIAGVGVTADYLAAVRIDVVAGSLPTASDFAELRPVMLITRRFASSLELEGDPIGQQLYFEGEDAPYTIVGILPSRDERPISIREAIVPMAPSATLTELTFAVEDARDLPRAVEELRRFASDRWGDGAVVKVQGDEFLGYYLEDRRRNLAIAALASAALLISACNAMGLLLSRAARDTVRIGIARTLGASRAAIRRRVLLEAGALGLLGGLAGAGASAALLRAYNASLASDSGNFQVQFALSPAVLALSLALAIGLCLVAAVYPAGVASRTSIVAAIGSA